MCVHDELGGASDAVAVIAAGDELAYGSASRCVAEEDIPSSASPTAIN